MMNIATWNVQGIRSSKTGEIIKEMKDLDRYYLTYRNEKERTGNGANRLHTSHTIVE